MDFFDQSFIRGTNEKVEEETNRSYKSNCIINNKDALDNWGVFKFPLVGCHDRTVTELISVKESYHKKC